MINDIYTKALRRRITPSTPKFRSGQMHIVVGIGSGTAFDVLATYFRRLRICGGSDPRTSQEC